ncbi:MAG: DUF547 domain-containing protein [Saprospiraceae bacterium]|nr:DUF547 domain-containing protein [Saprospiraceae bacterium]
MKYIILILFCQFGFHLIYAQPDYKNLDAFLKEHININGEVNYTAIKAHRGLLDKLVADISSTKVANNWSKNDQLAFWINAYNIFTIKLITDNYPLKSIQNLDGGKPWDVKRITIGGTKYSLNQIENDIIRAKFKDPRIHFAVNCGAKSCPPILNAAYTGNTIDVQLNDVTTKFINNSKYQTITASKITLSKIFDWYAIDFGNIINFINKYSKSKINKDATIGFKEYDWALNDKK